MWLPPMVMQRVMTWLSLNGAFRTRIDFNNWSSDGNIGYCVGIMWVEWFVYALLVWYLDKVLVVGDGTRAHPLFFMEREFWRGAFRLDHDGHTANELPDLGSIPMPAGINESAFLESFPEDAKAEHRRVVTDNGSKVRVAIVRLSKKWPNCTFGVKCLSLGVNNQECFGLLGHNGAGKTTTINMLTGLLPPTHGDARLGPYSIRKHLPRIHARLGVCPQDNILWNNLSARAHLLFYGRLKGLHGEALDAAVVRALSDVNLLDVQNRWAGKFSGGMKRRLSVAIALMGNPPVVYLDEPSTGLDPASKRQLWDVISRAKGDKSIVLTTHSMEEADVLCDRVGIMAKGELQCIGTPAELKRRYGAGYVLNVTTADATEEMCAKLDAFVRSLFPTAKLLSDPLGGVSKESHRAELFLSDWGLVETTLEEVFLILANEAHVSTTSTDADDVLNQKRRSIALLGGRGRNSSKVKPVKNV